MTGKHGASDPAPRARFSGAGEPKAGAGEPKAGAREPKAGARQPKAAPRHMKGARADSGDAPLGAAAGGDAGPGDDALASGDTVSSGNKDNEGVDDSDGIKNAIDLSEIESFLSGSGLSGSGELEEIVAQRDEYLDSLRRLQADFDNYRKRGIRQQTELVERANEGLLVRLLPVLDALDLAMAHLPAAGKGSDSEAMKSLTQIGMLLRDVLEREGLERIDKVGVLFDPTIHDAVARTGPEDADGDEAEGDEAEGDEAGGQGQGDRVADDETAPDEAGSGSPGDNSVAAVMRSGYRLKGRVLRPAMVAVRG